MIQFVIIEDALAPLKNCAVKNLIHISELSKRSAPLNGHRRLLKPKLCKGSNTHMARRISHKASRNNRIYESFTNFAQHKHSNMHYVHHHLLLRHTHAHARAHVHTHTHSWEYHCISGRLVCVNLQSQHGAPVPEHSLQKYIPAWSPKHTWFMTRPARLSSLPSAHAISASWPRLQSRH